jgi:hypothetical protein
MPLIRRFGLHGCFDPLVVFVDGAPCGPEDEVGPAAFHGVEYGEVGTAVSMGRAISSKKGSAVVRRWTAWVRIRTERPGGAINDPARQLRVVTSGL